LRFKHDITLTYNTYLRDRVPSLMGSTTYRNHKGHFLHMDGR